jgi:hypothetical protein
MGPSNVPANWLTDIGMGMYHTDTYVPPEGVRKQHLSIMSPTVLIFSFVNINS